jgi:hypothetical protein
MAVPRVLLQRCVIVVLFVLAATASAWAQTAEVSGRVTDESGAVLPGVTVTVTQTDTGFIRSVVTDGSGSYVMPNLPTGPYRLEVALQGFRTYVQTGIVLQVASSPVINPVLALGDLAETVTVEAAVPLVDVRSSGISDVVEQERIVELPLQGRQVTDLIVLAGAAVQTRVADARDTPGSVGIGVAGGIQFGVGYLLDGAIHNDSYNNLNLPLPFPDALQEFRVATSGLSAQNGMHSGASVNAVTKSGTNRLSGNVFEFLRDKQFNATNPFASVAPDGRRRDDGLRRNQFGGTLGGPIVRDRLFFFGAYQGTRARQTPSDIKAWVPTAAMLAGDFTEFASPACNSGRQITLRAPFVNNRVSPAQFSPAALYIARTLPTTTDPCGAITYGAPADDDEWQAVGKIDFQLSADHSLFTRYLHTDSRARAAWPRSTNILTSAVRGRPKTSIAKSVTFGDTLVFGSNMVNSFRAAFNRTHVDINMAPFLDAPTAGVKMYTYIPGAMVLNITGGFSIGTGGSIYQYVDGDTYQVGNDFTMVRGNHQIAVGGTFSYWDSFQLINGRSPGDFTFNGSRTGLGLADFMVGQLFRLEHGAPGILPLDQTHIGVYAQDAWRLTDRITFNGGIRWEPFFGQNIQNGSISNFNVDNWRKGVRTTKYLNAPPGMLYPGDSGFPSGNSAMNRQWWNLSPRAGIAWDVYGDGRMAVRSSYGLSYDFMTAAFLYIAASAPPFANRIRLEAVSFDDPYAGVPGGDLNPIPVVPPPNAPYPVYGSFGAMNPDINSPRVQSWNATVERQVGRVWQAAVSYLGNHTDRLWGQVAINPGVFLGLGPCTLQGISYPTCTAATNLDQRRVLSLENPAAARLLGPVDLFDSIGTSDYHGLKLSMRRTAASGLSLNGNYTLSRCVGNTLPNGFPQISNGYLKPDDPDFDRGNCPQNRTHLATLTLGAQTPAFANAGLRALASNWRVSGILNARSGSWLDVTTGRDVAGTGIQGNRVNQVLDDPYGAKTLTNYLNAAAFAYPDMGTLGNMKPRSVQGPGFWAVDLALSRLIRFGAPRTLELRLEAFNLLNNFNWGNPISNYDSGSFGQINSLGGDPRILQFGIKYGF